MIITEFVMNLQEELEKRDLTESSVLQYIKILINLHKKIYNHEQIKSLNFLKDLNKVEEAIEDNYKENTQKNIYNSLSSILFPLKEKKGFKKVYEFYNSKGKELNTKVSDKNSSGEKTETQKDNWIEWSDVIKIRNDLHDEVDKIKLKKNITEKDYETLLKNLVISLYTYLPPRRNEYQSLLLTPTEKELDENKNYYVIDEHKIILNNYKTSKKYGKQEIEIPDDLKDAVRNYLQFHTLYSSNKKKKKQFEIPFLVNRNGEPLVQVNSLTRILNKVFKKNIGASMLRHIYLSDKYGDEIEEMKDDAESMGHSLNQQKDYVKKD